MNESRYRLVRPLAMGGMAELFLGVVRGAEGFEKSVAIKRMLPHLASEPTLAQMFLAEARLATHLQHQNIASVYDVGSSPEGLFLVMELVDGWDLGVLLRHAHRRGQRFPPHLVALIGAQVLAGLIHAYRRTHNGRPVLTAHRDVSPSNILISREGEVKVTDFGIARLEGVSMGTQPGTFKGKLPYASPETLHGQPATALSDMFGLGIVLYELLAGHHPFGDDAGEPMSFALAITQREPPPLTDVPAPLAAVVMRAMAKAPETRFPRPEDMAEALARYLAQAGEPATSQSLATFIASLTPPLTLVERAQAAESADTELGPMERTIRRPSLSTRAVNPPSFELQPVEDEPEQLPGGPALSMSGRLVLPTAPAPAPAPSPAPAPARAPARAPVTPAAAAPRVREFRCSRCNAPLASAHAPCDRCAQDLSPELSSLAEEVSSPQATSSAPLRSVLDMKESELELADRGPRKGTVYEPPRARIPWGRVATTLATLLLLGGAAVVGYPYLRPTLTRLFYSVSPKQPLPLLSIQSQPEGATVVVDGTEIGTTPMVLDNTYASGQDIPVQLTLKGYKSWKGTFTGGKPESLEVRLRR
ncbi:serine/threonine-protein kinase [Archangium lansingense]|uniref:Serine/threonine protein kinase n=1 Tax=Archangium lansingense TaxID=2995310 RepID=A0ABT4AGH9_9BACT|nr:serine/threonine-protein kinase [Archangium lansinium]MCY1080789.1 serine/threonine protein kinase [Archangium lansinium]